MPHVAAAFEPTARQPRSKTRVLFAAMVVFCVLMLGYGCYHKLVVPRRHSDSIGRLIDSLATRRPPNMTRGQWATAVSWTHNLHANSSLMFDADTGDIFEFEQRLQTRLSGDVDMETIHWIWGEYSNISANGMRYQRFKPLMLEDIENVRPNDVPLGMSVP